MSDPRFLATLRAEVDAFYDEHNGAAPTYLETQQMPYLVAVVREATRLFPSIPFQLLRHVPKTGLEVDGYRLREGTRVGVSAIAANRDPAIWGADAEEFRPERWLESEEKSRFLESHSLVFGGNGARACIGKNIALVGCESRTPLFPLTIFVLLTTPKQVEMHKFLSQLVRTFDFEIVDKANPWRVRTYWFAYQHDFHVRVKPRDIKAGGSS
jgi:hypothetical protein